METQHSESLATARILVIDDHPLIRRGLVELISDEPGLEVCGEAADGEEALGKVGPLQPDLIVVDISLKGINGIELIKRVRARYPDLKMLVCSMHGEAVFAERALRAGAMGYINKEVATEHVIDAIHQVLEGEMYLSRQVTDKLVRRAVHGNDTTTQSAVEVLSDRELEVFELIGRGYTTRQSAEKLHLSIKTIESHREHIKTKLILDSGAELTRYAIQWVLENA